MRFEDNYYNKVYQMLHLSVDRLVDAAATCEAHGDILSAEDDDDEPEEVDRSSEDQAEVPKGSALKLLKAQLQVKGGDKDIPLLQALVFNCSGLLVEHKARLKIQHQDNPQAS